MKIDTFIVIIVCLLLLIPPVLVDNKMLSLGVAVWYTLIGVVIGLIRIIYNISKL